MPGKKKGRKADKFSLFGGIAGGLRARRMAIESGDYAGARKAYRKGLTKKKRK